jgi:hypothetical protein
MGAREIADGVVTAVNRYGRYRAEVTGNDDDLESVRVTDQEISGTLTLVPMTLEELASLREDRDMLRALEAAGVDNWEGHDHAMSILRGEG